ncbi:MAG: enoyl-CoA hydratase/isomerase family protein [Chloroflexi bacterium]|nr:enoyl-CoA hydratase/isomerase family protein [Chloroflexota bacterium]
MTYTQLLLDRELDGQVARITLNRPERLNALNAELTAELYDVLGQIQRDPQVRVVILTGAGTGFCSGADVTGMATSLDGGASPRAPGNWINRNLQPGVVQLAAYLRDLRQPIIAAVNGVAAGAGMSIALASDIRIASDQARFTMRFIKRSIVADTGSTHTLPLLVGTGMAAELIFTGKIIDAQTAKAIGLVNRVVPHERLLDEARELAAEIATNPPITVQLDKIALYRGLRSDLREAIDHESTANAIAMNTEDFQEGVRAFIEKREPRFTGR